jgi:hypothetical protein
MLRRKGDPTDIILFLVIVFFLVVSLVIAIYTNTIIHKVISDTVLNESAAYNSIDQAFTKVNDYGVQRTFTFIWGLLIFGIIVSSFLVRVHPVFMFLYIIMLVVTIFISIFLANSYALIVENQQLADISDKFEMMTWLMQHIVKVLIGVGALSMVIIFGKIGGGGNSSSNQQDI